MDVPPDALPQVIDKMAERFGRELARAEAAELWTATYVLIGLRYDEMLAGLLLGGVREIMKESVTYQAIVEEGREEGRAEAKCDALIKLATRRFGRPHAGVRAELESASSLPRLDAGFLRVLDATGWEDLLAVEEESVA